MENENPTALQENGSGSRDSFTNDGHSRDINPLIDGDDNLSPISDSELEDDRTNDTTDARPVSPFLDAVSQETGDVDKVENDNEGEQEAKDDPPAESSSNDFPEDVEMKDLSTEQADVQDDSVAQEDEDDARDQDEENNNTSVASVETSQQQAEDDDEPMDVDETDRAKSKQITTAHDNDSTNMTASENITTEDIESINISTVDHPEEEDVTNTEIQEVYSDDNVQEIEVGLFKDVIVATDEIISQSVYDQILENVQGNIILDNVFQSPEVPSPPARYAIQENEIRRMDDGEVIALEQSPKPCLQCLEEKVPYFKMIRNNELDFFCSDECVDTFKASSSLSDVLFVTAKRIAFLPYPLQTLKDCDACDKKQLVCKFKFKALDKSEDAYLCSSTCLDWYTGSDRDKFVVYSGWFEVNSLEESDAAVNEICCVCNEAEKSCSLKISQVGHVRNSYLVCGAECRDVIMNDLPPELQPKKSGFHLNLDDTDTVILDEEIPLPRCASDVEKVKEMQEKANIQKCHHCSSTIEEAGLSNIHWQLMDFCCSDCLFSYCQEKAADNNKCGMCSEMIGVDDKSIRFTILHGSDSKSFCNESCLVRYKDTYRICWSCTKSTAKEEDEGIEESMEKRRFCSTNCKDRFDRTIARIKLASKNTTNVLCHVCTNERPIEVTCQVNNKVISLCSQACLSAFKFANNIEPVSCRTCSRFFEKTNGRLFNVHSFSGNSNETHSFCTQSCRDLYVVREAIGAVIPCNWCGINKRECDLMRLRPFDDSYKSALVCSIECERLLRFVAEQRTQRIKDTWSCTFCQTTTSFDAQRRLILLQDVLGDSASWRSYCSRKCARSSTNEDELDESRFAECLRKITSTSLNDILEVLLKPRPILSVRDGLSLRAASNESFGDSGQHTYLDNDEDHFQAQPLPPKRGRGRQKKAVNMVIPTQERMIPSLPEIRTQIITVGPPPTLVRNCGTSCRPVVNSRGTMARVKKVSVECQTDPSLERKYYIPIPVPIYVPTPLPMYSLPVPTPVPIAIPIPVPVFIPTTRNSSEGIMKEIKKIQDKMPTDPYEAELLLMAEMVAEEATKAESDSDSDDDRPLKSLVNNGQMVHQEYHHLGSHAVAAHATVGTSGVGNSAANTASTGMEGEDMLMMALKMAYDEPAPVDLETTMAANTITQATPVHHHMIYDQHHQDPQQHHQIIQHLPHVMGGHIQQQQQQQGHSLLLLESVHHQQHYQQQPEVVTPSVTRGRKRGAGRGGRGGGNNNVQSIAPQPVIQPQPPIKRANRGKDSSGYGDSTAEQHQRDMEKAESTMCLKYTFGVNAWKQWVLTKNSEFERGSSRRKPFKTDILSLTTEELNYSLSLFVKEVRKPNGSEYAPDTIYYLVLGIQQYLYENGRIDNIFTDVYFESFTNCLDDVAKKFSVLYNDSQYIVTRVEEEHLWECKQLGAHSPHVLLSTLMFFNTKHFNLTTVDEHMQLSFSHIMKHWKRSGNVSNKAAGMRNVLLRFYPPQAALDANSRKKKVYEQSENEENPLRCPVKLYEFYLSKCPESVKTRNDVFYLLPERSCVPDSPVWYSTQALGQPALSKMLHRVKMVKEINIALLTS